MVSKYLPVQPRHSPSMSGVEYTRRGRSLQLGKRKEKGAGRWMQRCPHFKVLARNLNEGNAGKNNCSHFIEKSPPAVSEQKETWKATDEKGSVGIRAPEHSSLPCKRQSMTSKEDSGSAWEGIRWILDCVSLPVRSGRKDISIPKPASVQSEGQFWGRM